jgi:hypothetical protein
MSCTFSEIPHQVFLLFEEIMWGGKYDNQPTLLTADERYNALTFCWFHEPPLMNSSSRTEITRFGLAAYHWNCLSKDKVPKKPAKKTSSKFAKKNINARMLEKIHADEECRGWPCTQWAKFLECSRPSVVATAVWKDLTMSRALDKAERAKTRRHKPKGSDQRRAAGQY